jgi:hypothetical protein
VLLVWWGDMNEEITDVKILDVMYSMRSFENMDENNIEE